MSSIRDEIRSILREELAALRSETRQVSTERVQISSSADLNRFAQDLVERLQDPSYASGVRAGTIQFSLGGLPAAAMPARPIVSTPRGPTPDVLDKKLVTESDIAAISGRHVRVARLSCITPLAQDEARRRGIRIERIEL
ncbi:hypothetical protein AB838_06310 [Rhodobacteraceae bacterium (ex Bugula neritina AB1)]|nr:hypothetical protein AB838_06310 [Rhodobacteraceae bacterium (ex Bugula neritina AB1)]